MRRARISWKPAENQQLDPEFIGNLKAVLFYLIHKELMDNWQLREIYHALGGDPKKKGPRLRRVNMDALQEFLKDFPDARAVRQSILEPPKPAEGKKSKVQMIPRFFPSTTWIAISPRRFAATGKTVTSLQRLATW